MGQISAKVKENWSEGQEYDTVVLHVGTNDLVNNDAKKVATEMDGLIQDLKCHTEKIAVSSVVKRYDVKISVQTEVKSQSGLKRSNLKMELFRFFEEFKMLFMSII
jgi:hypothetical protein